MLARKTSMIFTLVMIFLLGAVTVSQAAPPFQEGDDEGSPLKTRRHPVAKALAHRLGVGYEEIISLHQQDYGFGQIIKAYTLAGQLNNKTAQAVLLEARQVGWGQLLQDNGLHPSAAGQGNKFGHFKSGPQGQGNRPAQFVPPGQSKKSN